MHELKIKISGRGKTVLGKEISLHLEKVGYKISFLDVGKKPHKLDFISPFKEKLAGKKMVNDGRVTIVCGYDD